MKKILTKSFFLKFILILNFALFACLNTAEGPSIEVAINHYSKSYVLASFLPSLRDAVNVLFSLVVFAFLISLGFRKSLMYSLIIIGFSCIAFPFFDTFGALLLLFCATGAVFAITKICIYAIISGIFEDRQEHASMLNLLEGFYTTFQVISFFIFSYFIGKRGSGAWGYVFWVYAVMAFVALVIWKFVPIDEEKIRSNNIGIGKQYSTIGIILTRKIVTVMFLFVLTFYVYIECSFFSWLPTFNVKALGINASLSIILASILLISIAVGRFIGSYLLKKIKWHYFLLLVITGATLYLFGALFLLHSTLNGSEVVAVNSISEIPLIAYVLPGIGLFLGPIYPALASATIKTVKEYQVAALLVLMQFFEGLGGIFGPIATGFFFGWKGPTVAFVFLLIPLSLLWLFMIFFNYLEIKKNKSEL